jgi:hypothetical protein
MTAFDSYSESLEDIDVTKFLPHSCSVMSDWLHIRQHLRQPCSIKFTVAMKRNINCLIFDRFFT